MQYDVVLASLASPRLSREAASGLRNRYGEFRTALASRFSAALVHGGDFVVSAMGDSTLAGADNCYFDSWINVLQRQLQPLLRSANINLIVRNSGHNGGGASNPQLACAHGITGADSADFLLSSFSPGMDIILEIANGGSLAH